MTSGTFFTGFGWAQSPVMHQATQEGLVFSTLGRSGR